MSIPFTCPHCGTQTQVDERFAGSTGPCASCGKSITIPAIGPGALPGSGDAAAVAGGVVAGGLSILAIIMIVGAVVLGLLCVIGILVALLLPAVQAAREAARRVQCANNLRQIAVAMQMYESEHGTYPPAYVADKDGKPMHSWRVLLLPYLEEQALYQQYNLDEPWDSPGNLTLATRMPSVYACPSDPQTASQETSYMVIVGEHTMFRKDRAVRQAECRDGTSNTLCVVEVANSSVGWTDPTDLDATQMVFDIGSGGNNEVGSFHRGGANVVYCDGHTQFLPDSTSAEELQALSTRDGGEEVHLPY